MESADGGQQDATRPQDLFCGRAQGVAPFAAKRDWHSLRRRVQRHCTPRQRLPTARYGGYDRKPGDSHGQKLCCHRPTNGHGGKAQCRSFHREHQARRDITISTIQPGRQWRTNPGTRTRTRIQRQSRRHHTNPWSTNRRRYGHQKQKTRPGVAHPILLDMRHRMQAQ